MKAERSRRVAWIAKSVARLIVVLCVVASTTQAYLVGGGDTTEPRTNIGTLPSHSLRKLSAENASSVLPSGCSANGSQVVCSYTSSSSLEVPEGIASVNFYLLGGSGGGDAGGNGGWVEGSYSLPISQSNGLSVIVGDQGGQPNQTSGGYPGGGSGGGNSTYSNQSGCGGGGLSGLVIDGQRMAIAGGGGGCGGPGTGANPIGGGSGGTISGTSGVAAGGAGFGNGGGGGSNSGGSGGGGQSGSDGGYLSGGGGVAPGSYWNGGGGGGGAGYYGGGGGLDGLGGSIASGDSGAGGGSGSSWAISGIAASSYSFSTSLPRVPYNGEAEIAWTVSTPTVAFVNPPSSMYVNQPTTFTTSITNTAPGGFVPVGETIQIAAEEPIYSGFTDVVTLCNATIDATSLAGVGTASCSYTPKATSIPGYPIEALYFGDGALNPVNGSISNPVAVNPDPTTISSLASVASSTGISLKATVNPFNSQSAALDGYVTFVVVGSDDPSFSAATQSNPMVACSTSQMSGTPGSADIGQCNFSQATPGYSYSILAYYSGAVFSPTAPSQSLIADSNGNADSSSATNSVYDTPGPVTVNLGVVAPTGSAYYGAQFGLQATLSGLPAKDSNQGLITYYDTSVTPALPLDCVDSNGTGSFTVTSTLVGGSYTHTVPPCTFTPTTAIKNVDAVYSGDSQVTTSSSPAQSVSVSPAPVSMSISVASSPSGLPLDVTVPVVVVVTETNTDNTGIPPDIPIQFDQGSSVMCASVSPTSSGSNSSVAKCAVSNPPTDLAEVTFNAFPASTGLPSDIADWAVTITQSAPLTFSYTPLPDPTNLLLSPSADSPSSPLHINAGTDVTVTATVTDQTGTSQPLGMISFFANGSAISSSSGGTCSNLTPQASTTSVATGTASCSFAPAIGTEVIVTATYNQSASDPLTQGSSSTNSFAVIVGGGQTSTTVSLQTPSGSALTSPVYGELAVTTARVTFDGNPVGEGTVDFSLNGSPLSSSGAVICQNVPVSNGVATCATSFTLPAGSLPLSAKYADSGGAFLDSSGSATPNVAPSATTTTLSVGPDVAQSTETTFDISVANDPSGGGTVAPVGSVTVVDQTGKTICTSSDFTFSYQGSTTTAQCSSTIASSSTSFVASFTPSVSVDFTPSKSSAVTYPTSSSCSASFANIWKLAAGTTLAVGAGPYGTGSDSLDFSIQSTSGSCSPTSVILLKSGTLSLFGGTISAGTIGGYVEDGASGPRLCLNSGALDFPTNWKVTPISLSNSSFCFSLTATSSQATVSGVASSTLQANLAGLPFGIPDSTLSYGVSLSFTNTASPQAVVAFGPLGATGAVPYVAGSISISVGNSGASAVGSATLYNLFAGSPAQATFAVTAGQGGTIAGSITVVVLPSGSTITPVPGLALTDISATLSDTSTAASLSTTGSAIVGDASHPIDLSFTGLYSAKTWSFTIASSTINWTPFSSLSISAPVQGTFSISASGQFSYDIEAGYPAASGKAPLVAWNPQSGVSLSLDCIALAYNAKPNCSSALALPYPVDPTLIVQGSAALGSSGGITVPVDGTLDLHTGLVGLELTPSSAPLSVSVASGVTISLASLTVTGGVGLPLDVSGAASAIIPQLGGTASQPLAVSLSLSGSSLLIAISGLNLSSIGVPLSGFFAYSTAAVTGYNTNMSGIGTVDLSPGLNVYALYTPPAVVVSALDAAGISISTGGTLLFSASWSPGSSPVVTASISAPANFPFLELPGGGGITGASLSYVADSLTFNATGTIPIVGSQSASVSLQVTIASDGSIAGSASVDGLSVFGTTLNLSGSVTRTPSTSSGSGGTLTASVSGSMPGPFSPIPSLSQLSFSNVTFDLSNTGLSLQGTASVDGLGSLTLSGSLSSMSNWKVSVSGEAANWTPAPDAVISAAVTGTFSDSNGTLGLDIQASGVGTQPLFQIGQGAVFSVNSVEIGNGLAPNGCTLVNSGDLFLAINGSFQASIAGNSQSVSAAGCFDLVHNSLSLSADFSALGFSAAGGAIEVSAPTISLVETNGSYSVMGQVTLSVTMPSGGSFSQVFSLAFESGGAFVVGGTIDLSSFLGSVGNNAYLFYASQGVASFDTGSPSIGSIALSKGLNFALDVTLPQSVVSALGYANIHLPSGTGLVATGRADFQSSSYTLKVATSFGTGMTLFSSGQASLVLDSGYLKIQILGGVVDFGVGMQGTLNVPSTTPSGPTSSVAVSGQVMVSSDASINIGVTIGQCGTSGGTPWTGAFGISNLTVNCAQLVGGISFDPLLPNIGFSGSISSLPTSIATAIGYQEGANISFAFNLNPPLLSFTIGSKGATTPALEPLSAFNQPQVLQIYYAHFYAAPFPVVMNSTYYPAGFSIGFNASIYSVNIQAEADIGISPPSFKMAASVSTINLPGPITIGPASIDIQGSSSPLSFKFKVSGSLALGPGSSNIGPDLKVGGYLNASAALDLSTSAISGSLSGSLGLNVSAYIAQSTCYTKVVPIPYPCNYQWQSTSMSFNVPTTGFAVSSGNIALSGGGYTVTFYFNGNTTVQPASYRLRRREGAAEFVALSERRIAHNNRKGHVSSTTVPPVTSTTNGASPPTTVVPLNPSAKGGGGSYLPTIGSWKQVTTMPKAHEYATVVRLNDGNVLVAGGASSTKILASAELYHWKTNSWSSVPPMNQARIGASYQLLKNGDVLIFGGTGSNQKPLASTEIYNPNTNSWTNSAPMATARSFATSVLLKNGDVFVTGGIDASHNPIASSEVYHPASNSWSKAADITTPRAFAAGALLPDGSVLVAGGQGPVGPLGSAEIFNPTTGSWTGAPSMSQPRAQASAVILANGNVLVLGDGVTGDLYIAKDGTWKTTDGMNVPRIDSAAVALANDMVLVVGGINANNSLSSSEILNPTTGVWTPAASLPNQVAFATAVVLPNNAVLVVGGASVRGGVGATPTITPLAATDMFVPPIKGAAFPTNSSSDSVIYWLTGGVVVVALGLGFGIFRRRTNLRSSKSSS